MQAPRHAGLGLGLGLILFALAIGSPCAHAGDPKSAAEYVERARSQLARDNPNFDEALKDLNAALGLDEKDTDVRRLRATVYGELMDWPGQVKDLSSFIDGRSSTGSYGDYEARGQAYLHLAEADKALSDFDAAIRLAQKHTATDDTKKLTAKQAADLAFTESMRVQDLVRAYIGRARALASKYEFDRALETLDAAMKVSSDAALLIDISSARGEVYLAMDRPKDALAEFKRAIQLAGGEDQALSAKPVARLKTYEAEQKHAADEKDAALELAAKAALLDPMYVPAHRIHGKLLADKSDADGAIAAYTMSIKLAPTNAAVYNARANAYLDKRDAKAAIADLTRATKLNRDDATYWITLGQLHFRLKQYPEALGCYANLSRIEPENAVYKFMVAIMYAVQDQADLASASLEPALFRAKEGETLAAARIAESVLAANPNVPALQAVTQRLREKAGLVDE